jgi:ubiquitin-protein ligase
MNAAANQTSRSRRLAAERALLERVAALNPEVLSFRGVSRSGADEEWLVDLRETEAIAGLEGGPERRREHTVRLRFPRFYPAQPLEAYLEQPVFHPNCDPGNGFVCLWAEPAGGGTVIEALRRLQSALCWRSYNLSAAHLMQPRAAEWIAAPEAQAQVPLAARAIKEDASFRQEMDYVHARRPRRQRLSR